MLNDPKDRLVHLDARLGRAWAKAEILLGLLAAASGLFLGVWQLTGRDTVSPALVCAALGLVVLGGYLALAGHRSHLYRWNNANTVTLLDEIRRLGNKGQP